MAQKSLFGIRDMFKAYKNYFRYYLAGVILIALLSTYVGISAASSRQVTPESVSSLYPSLVIQPFLIAWLILNVVLLFTFSKEKPARSWYTVLPKYYLAVYILEGVLSLILLSNLTVKDVVTAFASIALIEALFEIGLAIYLLIRKPFLSDSK